MKLDEATIHAIQEARGGHVIFAPSGSALWTACPGGLIPNLLAEDTAGYDAAEGTVGHQIAEEWLTSGKRPLHRLGEIIQVAERAEVHDIEVTWEMLDYIEEYVQWVDMLPGEHFTETRVDFSDLTPIPHQSGTADHGACHKRSLTVSDLKYGKGVQVFAKNNTQLIIYAYGFFRLHDPQYHFETITLRIGQPRLQHFDEWTITREELLEWAAWIKERAYAAWDLEAPRKPSVKACQWCNIKAGCAALAVLVMRVLDGDPSALDYEVDAETMEEYMTHLDNTALSAIEIDQLTVAQKAKLYQYRKLVEKFFSDIHVDLEERVVQGETVPGCKLVNGRTSRDFTSETAALDHLDFLGVPLEEMYERNLKSPAKTEELLRKHGYSKKVLPIILAPVIRKTMGRPTLALDSDRRQAMKAADDGVFDDDI